MKNTQEKQKNIFGLLAVVTLVLFSSISFIFAAPSGPDGITFGTNETKGATPGLLVNISGGYISTFNLTATLQNPRWKAFVGQVIGSFTLDDAASNTIYDWTLATVTGRVYATRNATTPQWGSIACATSGDLEAENLVMNLDNDYDNITATFDDSSHGLFFVGGTQFTADSCLHTVNTYVGGSSTAAFEEVALSDGSDIVYAGLLEEDSTGFDGNSYDFQMIVPEDGTPGFSGATPYYLYVELD